MPSDLVTRAQLKQTVDDAQADGYRVSSIVPVGEKFLVVTEKKEDTTGRPWTKSWPGAETR